MLTVSSWHSGSILASSGSNTPFLPTAYVVQGKVMFWHVSVLQWFCLSTPRGGYPCQVQLGRGGVPWLGGTPPQVPPHRTFLGGYPNREGTPSQVVLDTLRSVCLLRSCRRTFLFTKIFCKFCRCCRFFSINLGKFSLFFRSHHYSRTPHWSIPPST